MKIENHLLRLMFSISGLFVFLNSFGQNYLPGYIIQLSGDTLHGFVDHNKWERNHGAIFFSVNSNERRVKYTPVDIKGFSFKDEIYKSAVVKTGINSSSLENKPGLDFGMILLSWRQ